MFFLLCELAWNELEDHRKVFVTSGSHTADYSAVFSNLKDLACLGAVLLTGIAAAAADIRAIRREETGSAMLVGFVILKSI